MNRAHLVRVAPDTSVLVDLQRQRKQRSSHMDMARVDVCRFALVALAAVSFALAEVPTEQPLRKVLVRMPQTPVCPPRYCCAQIPRRIVSRIGLHGPFRLACRLTSPAAARATLLGRFATLSASDTSRRAGPSPSA